MRNLLAMLMLSPVAGCFGLTNVNSQPPCSAPTVLPDRALNDQEAEIYWGRDRQHLVECYWRNEVASGRKGPPKS